MRVVLGLKAHSGWAALVALGRRGGDLVVADRRRIELMEEAWHKHPYHAAEKLPPAEARDLVRRGIDSAHRLAVREMRATLERAGVNDVTACALVAGAPMPSWSVEEILAVHFRMHKAEGALFRDALARAAGECGLRLVAIPEKTLTVEAARTLGIPAARLAKTMAELGKSVGPPWGKDQKEAALAALVALEGRAGGAPAAAHDQGGR